MRRRIGVVAALAAAVLAVVLWRCSKSSSDRTVHGGARTAQRGLAPGSAVTPPRVDPRTLARASIAGTITDRATGQPIAGARVCADGWSHDAPSDAFGDPACTDSDAAGTYRIDGLLAAHYAVVAAARTYRPRSYEVPGKKRKTDFVLAPGEQRRGVDIALDPGGVEITGTVSDITGGPVARASVRAGMARWGGGTAVPPVETDDKGRYSIWVRPGPVTLTASADGYADARELGKAPGSIDLLLTPESSLSGTVVDGTTGAPVEGASVTVEGAGYGWRTGREVARTDAEGKFRVTRLTPGRYVTTARTERGYGRSEGSTLVGLGQHVEGVVVALHGALKIQGKIVIKGSPPTTCTEASAWFRDDANDRWVSARTEDDGTLTAEGVVPGTYTANIGCEGYANSKPKYDPVVVADKDVVGLVWEVEAGATIKGRVLTKQGQPIADAEINARTTGGEVRAHEQWASTTSKLDGSYELEGLRPGTYALSVETAKAVAPREEPKVVAAAGKTVEKDLVLDDGGRIEGVVVDEQGKPVAEVRVDANSLANDWTWRWGDETRSDAQGRFAIDAVRPGDYRVVASRGWFETLRKPGTTDDQRDKQGERVTVRVAETVKVRLVVESQSGTIKGIVIDADGKPVSDAFLSAARESDAAGARDSHVSATREWDWGDDKPTLTGVDGTFAITKLSPGKYTIRAYRKGGGEAVVEHVAVGATTRLQIKHTGTISGIARRAGGDKPPDEISVTVADLTTGLDRTETFYRTGGKFTIRDLPKGTYHVTAQTEGGRKKIELVLAEGEHKSGIELVFESLVTITGRVVDLSTKAPIAGMRVYAQAATGSDRFVFSWGEGDNENITDADGRFTVKDVPRGQILVQGMAKEWKDADHGWFRTVKTIGDAVASPVDIGEVHVIKRRVKEGEKSGELGLNFKQQPPDTAPDKRVLEVSYIDPDGPAAKIGIKVGDVIVAVDGVDVTGGNAMHAWTLMNAPPGTRLVLGLARGATVTIVLAHP